MKILKENIGYIILTLLTLVLSIVDKSVPFVATLITLTVYSMIQYKPILALSLVLLKQIIYLVVDPSLFGRSIGINLIFLLIALIINVNIAKPKEGKLKDRLVAILNYERGLLKVKTWFKIIIYSFIVTLIMSVTKLDTVQQISTEPSIQVFTAIALLLPTLEFLSILSNSTIFTDIIFFSIIFKSYTLVELNLFNIVKYTEFWEICLALFALVYGAYKGSKCLKK